MCGRREYFFAAIAAAIARIRDSMYKRLLRIEEKDAILTVDFAFSSPSTAASIIGGASLSGAKWKTDTQMTGKPQRIKQ